MNGTEIPNGTVPERNGMKPERDSTSGAKLSKLERRRDATKHNPERSSTDRSRNRTALKMNCNRNDDGKHGTEQNTISPGPGHVFTIYPERDGTECTCVFCGWAQCSRDPLAAVERAPPRSSRATGARAGRLGPERGDWGPGGATGARAG
eukprot:gene25630-biopygen4512